MTLFQTTAEGASCPAPPAVATDALLEVQGLEVAYGAGQVLFGVNLSVPAGGGATLLGRNGMGKTTTVKAMLGLLQPLAGRIWFRGERIDGLPPDRIARMGLAVVPTSLVDGPQQLAEAPTKDLHAPSRHGEASLKDVGAATRLVRAVTWVALPAGELARLQTTSTPHQQRPQSLSL